MKRLFLLLIALALLCAVSCGKGRSDLAGGYRIGTGEDALIGPSLTLNEDGTFSYSPSIISSYMGVGRYTLEGDAVTLLFGEEETGLFTFTEDGPEYEPARTAEQAVGVFTVTEEGLRFKAAETTAWALDGLEDGTLFIKNR